jgi:hypothetical protein
VTQQSPNELVVALVEPRERKQRIAGFEEFRRIATVHAFEEGEHQIDVISRTGVASVTFDMTYALKGQRFRSTGRDVRVFESV